MPRNLPLHCPFLEIKQSHWPGRPLNNGLFNLPPSPPLLELYPLTAASALPPPPPFPWLLLEHYSIITLSSSLGLPPPAGPRPQSKQCCQSRISWARLPNSAFQPAPGVLKAAKQVVAGSQERIPLPNFLSLKGLADSSKIKY